MVRRTKVTGETPAEVAAEAPHFDTKDLEQGSNLGANAALLSFCERFERLSEEIKTLSEDRTEVMAEAKSYGFSTKTLRQAIRRRAMDAGERQEADAMLELYEAALNRAEKAAFKQSQDDGE